MLRFTFAVIALLLSAGCVAAQTSTCGVITSPGGVRTMTALIPMVSRCQSPAAGTPITFNVYVSIAGSTSFDVGVYSDNAGKPGTLLCHTGTVTLIAKIGYNALALPGCPPVAANQFIWIGVISSSSFGVGYFNASCWGGTAQQTPAQASAILPGTFTPASPINSALGCLNFNVKIGPAPTGPVVTSVTQVLTVNGTGFIPTSVVTQGGVACTSTTFVSSTQLTAKCPTGVIAVTNPAASHSVKLTWSVATVPAGAPPVTSYNILKGTSSSGPFSTLSSTANLAYTDTNVTAGQIPCYTVQAVNSVAPSPNATPVCITVP